MVAPSYDQEPMRYPSGSKRLVTPDNELYRLVSLKEKGMEYLFHIIKDKNTSTRVVSKQAITNKSKQNSGKTLRGNNSMLQTFQ